MNDFDFKPGSLVNLRGRTWVVMPSNDPDLMMVKPLGGPEEESTGIYLPLGFNEDIPKSADFPPPTANDIGSYGTAKLLFNASRLSFRNVAGPFRCLGKISFRPRPYQIIPLIMSLKLETMRLLIADDVGIGKTIESLLIVKEFLERGEIKNFAVICPPHLCDQWGEELRNKFSINAVIIRSSTAAQLDRRIQGDISVFRYFPYQIISIDYIKQENKRQIFLNDIPDLVVIDEVHTCARPSSASIKQQQRYYLLHDIAKKTNQKILMLTATPHSGKQNEFQSLLGLLDSEFEAKELIDADNTFKRKVGEHYVQRRRGDVMRWMGEDTPFPKRDSGELGYTLSEKYKNIFLKVLKYARSKGEPGQKIESGIRFKYFALLTVLRGIMSSPQAGIGMLVNQIEKLKYQDEINIDISDDLNQIYDNEDGYSDNLPTQILDKTEFNDSDRRFFKEIISSLEEIKGFENDSKIDETYKIIIQWLKEGFNPIIFCRFIATANYVGEILKSKLPADIEVTVITGEMVDEERKEKILEIGKSEKKKVLVATDCLSEGINLQEYFTAVLHYDLPWNPNRLEQREGRIDRYGQTAAKVKIILLYGKDNPIDSVVFKVLLEKARQIRSSNGICLPPSEDNQNIREALLNAVILNPKSLIQEEQIGLFKDPEILDIESKITRDYEEAVERTEVIRSIFAQHSIKIDEIEQDLKESDEFIGKPEVVEQFVVDAVRYLGAQIKKYKEGHEFYTTNLDSSLKSHFEFKDKILISFYSPTPKGYQYIGRNHPFVERLCYYLLNLTFDRNITPQKLARSSVIRTKAVNNKTVIFQFRVRNVISETGKKNELIAEEMYLWGYEGLPDENKFLFYNEAKKLLESATPSSDITKQFQTETLNNEIKKITKLNSEFEKIARERSQKLVEAHERFRKAIGGKKYKVVEPVFPPDIIGVYILLPEL